MTEKDVTVNPELEQQAEQMPTCAQILRGAIKQKDAAPFYIIEKNTDYRPLLGCPNGYIWLETVIDELQQENIKLEPGEEANTPVIIRSNPNNKQTEKKAAKLSGYLQAAGVTVYRQDSNKPFKVITCTSPDAIQQEILKQYQDNYSAGGAISEFEDDIRAKANTPAIKTGFPILDNVLDGGLYEGLYAVGAISSLGKTTFCLNIADQIAAQGHDVYIFALEMSKFSLMARSVSRKTFEKYLEVNDSSIIPYNYCKTSRGISDGSRYTDYTDAEKEFIQDAQREYAKIAQHIYIHEAVGNLTVKTMQELIKRHIEYTGNTPVVIVDYLQLIKNEDPRINSNDKTRTDYNLTELKQLSRDNQMPIIVISSFNRAGYNTEVKMENFKESGGIDYGFDVIMGLQLAGVGRADFNVNQAKAKDPREIELVFLKNREAPVGDMVKYYYYPKFNHFIESDEDPRAEREYAEMRAKEAKEKAKQSRAEELAAEHAALVKQAYDACVNNGYALLTDMVDFCGGKPGEKTLKSYVKSTGDYTILGNKIIRNKAGG